jgi:peroxiredoxin
MRNGDRWVRYGFVVAAVVLGAVAVWWAGSQAGGITQESERKAMPAVVLEQLGGGEWRMADHRGQVVLLNYWATWCGPCWEETPGLVRLAKELGPQGLAVVGISVDEGGREKVRKFVEDFKVPYPVAFPAAMSQLEWGLEGVPTTILVDREGRVAKSYLGAVREADFRRDVEALLAEKAVAAAGS